MADEAYNVIVSMRVFAKGEIFARTINLTEADNVKFHVITTENFSTDYYITD